MRRTYQLIAAVVVTLLVPVLSSAPTYAASTCDIGFTGPNSQNLCTSVETYSCTVTNQNNVVITNSSGQTAASGTVTVGQNGSGGGAVSGSVGNNNNATFTVTITNQGDEGVCSTVVTVPATETPPTPTLYSVNPTPVAAANTAAPKALPVTGDDATLPIIATAAGIASLIAAISVAATIVHRRLNAS